MGRTFDHLDDTLVAWIRQQPVFFVATAPTGHDGYINVSPKGAMDTFRIVSPTQVAYLDLIGSGVETIAHLRENGRIVVMFCSFNGPPKVLRLHGHGRVVEQHDTEFRKLVSIFDPSPDVCTILRSVIVVDVTRISDSCGFVVPRMELVEERDQLVKWGHQQQRRFGCGWKDEYLQANNLASIDGLPGLRVDTTTLSVEELRARSSEGKAL